jgi:ferredoxin--NADP+ reductase
MMEAIANLTRPFGIKTVVSLNSIMIDGTGMCGGCRAIVDGETVFVCVDGPEFDAHTVNFKVLKNRNNTYLSQEKVSVEDHECHLDKAFDLLTKIKKEAV